MTQSGMTIAAAPAGRVVRRRGRSPHQFAPKPGACCLFLELKGRFCSGAQVSGSRFCGNHRPAEEVAQANLGKRGMRIPCPLDPTHTIFETHLSTHLKICNKTTEVAKLGSLSFYRAGINTGPRTSPKSGECHEQALDIEEILVRLLALYQARSDLQQSVEEITTGRIAEAVIALIKRHGWGFKKARHVIQQASILSHLDRRWPIKENTCCVELGCGRGTLGYALSLAFPQTRLILIEKAGVKFKADAAFRRPQEGYDFERHRIDIRDLYLKGLSLPPRSLFMGKHVCGVATDLTLRSIQRFRQDDPKAAANLALVIACCCYHAIEWQDYVGVEAWEQQLGLGRTEFEIAKKTACWAASLQGTDSRQVVERKEQQMDDEQNKAEAKVEQTVHGENQQLDGNCRSQGKAGTDSMPQRRIPTQEKILYGIACKALIDWGRLEFLRSIGLRTEYVQYVRPQLTPENRCLIAYDTFMDPPVSVRAE